MNTSFLYATILSLIQLLNVRSQQSNDANFVPETDFDYTDFQQVQRTPIKLTPIRGAKPRAPVVAVANQQNKVTPVPILKQINRHNEDGSYTYGFEGADGSFKIETKLATGEVIGKYGYVDDSGKLRVVEYGANKYGFQPAGEGITIPAINIENDTDTTENYENDSIQHTSRPEIKVPPPSRSQKKKPQQKPIHFVTQEQRTRPQTLSQYFVQEQEDTHQPENQRQYISASDINSLQFLIGNEQREYPTLQYHSNNIPSLRRQFLQPTTSEEDSQNSERLFRSGVPFPATFEADSSSQFQITPNQLLQTRFSSSFEAEPNNKKFSKGQLRPKSKSQFLVTPTDDIRPQNVIRRNSNINQGNSRSILDELLKQYPIPNGSPAINDFSFTYN